MTPLNPASPARPPARPRTAGPLHARAGAAPYPFENHAPLGPYESREGAR